MPEASQIIARRIGRITFGGVLLAGLVYLLAASCSDGCALPCMHDAPGFHAARIIGLTWVAALAAGLLAARIAARLPIAFRPDRLFAESWIAPALGIALLLPITLHMPVVLLVGDAQMFDTWVVASIWITGLAHAVFAATCALRAYQLTAGRRAWTPRSIYVATLITSCVPFIVLYAIPPAIVALTALPFVPLLRAMETLVVREREEIARALHPLPRAILRRPGA